MKIWQFIWYLFLVGLAVAIDIFIIRVWREYRKMKKSTDGTIDNRLRALKILEAIKQEIEFSLYGFFRILKTRFTNSKGSLIIMLEIGLIGLWAIFVGSDYLNLDPRVIPTGREFSSAIQTHHLWTRFLECGTCAFWNGSVRGGLPMFADVHGSMLHPIVIITTIIFGVVNGAKVAIVIALWFAGIAQWWLAKELRLGWVPRIWSGGMAVVGGHITGRMELGAFGVVLSTAMCSLVFCGILNVTRGGGKRGAVILGILIASALLSGQGYIQVGLVGIFPTILFFILDRHNRHLNLWKEYLIALVIAFLLAAPFLVPFLHFSPNFLKDADLQFSSAQPLIYMPLNLVVDDWQFYNSEVLGKFPYPHLYTLFIGWLPVFLALVGLRISKEDNKSYFWFFITGIVIEFLIGSAIILRWIANIFPGIAGVRHPPQITGLAVPLILALSAYGLEYIIKLPWPKLYLEFSEFTKKFNRKISLRILLVIPLIYSLREGYLFSEMWIFTNRQDDGLFEVVDQLETISLQWVNPPFGEHGYIEYAVRKGLKISPGILSWKWDKRTLPIPVLEANRAGPPPGNVNKLVEVDGIPIYKQIDLHYAGVYFDDTVEPCVASGNGGHLFVQCSSSSSGRLVVQENTWSGWKAWIDGERVPLLGDHWLEVEAPAGKHTYQFRYRPWDVPIGISLSIIGILACFYLWFFQPKYEEKNNIQS